MKPQDIVLLLKLVTLERPGLVPGVAGVREMPPIADDAFSVRGLGDATGISKSEVSAALRRCIYAGLARVDHETGQPSANTYGLSEFLLHGIKYVFPVKPGRRVRGVPTAHSAPVWAGKLLSGGQVFVWADAEGEMFGEHIEPLFKSVPAAARRDPVLHGLLALIDSVRVGRAREAGLAKQWLQEYLRGVE